MSKKIITCKKCGSVVKENINVYKSKKYPYECPTCKEGKYSCDVNK